MKKRTVMMLLIALLEIALWIGFLVVQKRVGQPWSGVMAFVAVGGMLLFTFLTRRKSENAQEAEFDEAEEAAARADKLGDLPETEEEEKLSCILVLHGLSGKIYQVFSTPRKYHFVHVGGELSGVDGEKLLDSAPTDSLMAELPGKNFSLDKSEVQKITLNLRRSASTQIPNSGTVSFFTPKKRSYVLLGEASPEQICAFFSDVGDRVENNQKTLDRRTRSEERDQAVGTWNRERQDPAVFRTLRTVTRVLTVAGAVSTLAFIFLARPYVLWSILCVACFTAAVVLGLVFPAYYSLNYSSSDSMKRTGAKCINLLGPLLASGFGPTLRSLMDFNFIPEWLPYAAAGVLSVVLAVLFALRLRELKGRIWLILAVWFLLLISCVGIPAQVNSLLDFRDPAVETVRVVDMHVSTSSRGPDSYICTVRRSDGTELDLKVGPETYEKTRVGDQGPMAVFHGGLGMPYAAFITP